MRSLFAIAPIIVTAFLVGIQPATADTTIDTLSFVNSYSGYGYKFAGQTFTAPQDSILTSFSFQLTSSPYEGTPDHRGFLTLFVAPYDTQTQLAGPTLFTSSPLPLQPSNRPDGALYTFATGQLTLAAGQKYLAYVFSSDSFDLMEFKSNTYDSDPSSSKFGDAYPAGEAVASNNLSLPFTPFADVTKTIDLGFIAKFSTPVPEASTTVSFGLLLALGLGGTVVAARRRKAGSGS